VTNPGGKGIREMGGHELIVSKCANCHSVVTFLLENADRVMGVAILPETGLPVDVQIVDGVIAPREYTPEEFQRAKQNRQPLCLNCAELSARSMWSRGMVPPLVDREAYEF
jgi:hypothetical protein